MSNDNKILDFTITLYSNKLKIVKEVVCNPTELEQVIEQLDATARVPKRGDGHHGYYIEVEIRRHVDVNNNASKRHIKPTARENGKVHSGGRGHADDRKPRGNSGRTGAEVRSKSNGLRPALPTKKARQASKEGKVNGSEARKTSSRGKGKVS